MEVPVPTRFLSDYLKTIELSFERKNECYVGMFTLLSLADVPRIFGYEDHYLTHEESTKLHLFPSQNRKMSYLAGRICAKESLMAYTGNANSKDFFIANGIFDQPIAVCSKSSGNLQVSISHCSDFCGAVVYPEQHPVGFDIESVNSRIKTFNDEIISASERRLLSTVHCDPDVSYTFLWTVKEALSKVLKTGLMTPFSLFHINGSERHGDVHEFYYEYFPQYKSISLELGNAVCFFTIPRRTNVKGDLERLIASIE